MLISTYPRTSTRERSPKGARLQETEHRIVKAILRTRLPASYSIIPVHPPIGSNSAFTFADMMPQASATYAYTALSAETRPIHSTPLP